MSVSNISFGNNEPQKKKSFFGAVKDSAIDVGKTAVVGGAVGGAAGKLASFIKYTPNANAMNFQYADIFEKAVTAACDSHASAPKDFLQSAGLNSFITSAKAQLDNIAKNQNILSSASFKEMIQNTADDAIGNEKVQNAILQFFQDAAAPQGGYTKAAVLDRLKDVKTDKNSIEAVAKNIAQSQERYLNIQNDFIKKASELKDTAINKIATEGAKHLRKVQIIGAGIGIGVITALVLNLLKTYGIIGRKKQAAQNSAQSAPNVPAASQAQTPIPNAVKLSQKS